MLLQEWKIEDAKAVWQREAEERGEKRGEERGEKRGEERSDRKWQSVILQKDAILADKDAEIAKLRVQLDRK